MPISPIAALQHGFAVHTLLADSGSHNGGTVAASHKTAAAAPAAAPANPYDLSGLEQQLGLIYQAAAQFAAQHANDTQPVVAQLQSTTYDANWRSEHGYG